MMMHDAQLAIGDVCGDPTGLRVKVEDVDIYDYVHFSVIENGGEGDDDTELGGMSHVAFVHRFTKLGNTFAHRTSAELRTLRNNGVLAHSGEIRSRP
jgi:hypothetical protein